MSTREAERIWLASYPRSGNTFFRICLNHWYGIQTGSRHKDGVLTKGDLKKIVGHRRKGGTFVKTHEKEPNRSQAIYIVRDGRQTVLSYWHHLQAHGTKCSLLDVIRGKPKFGAWSEHVRFWLSRTPEPTIVKYEDLITRFDEQNMRTVLASVGYDAVPITDRPVISFDKLHSMSSRFFRLGETDEWKNVMGGRELDEFYKLHGGALMALGYVV